LLRFHWALLVLLAWSQVISRLWGLSTETRLF
jgi:hypothetical protein